MKPQLFRIITFCNFLLLTWTGLLHFTSGMNYEPLFVNGETMTYWFGMFLMVVGLISLFPLTYLRMGGLRYLYFFSALILFLFSINEMLVAESTIERLFVHTLEILLPFSVFLQLSNENKKRNWKEIFYFGLFFTLCGQGLIATGVSGDSPYLLGAFERIFGFDTDLSKQVSFGFGTFTMLVSLLLFVAQTRVYAFWYLLIYSISVTTGTLVVRGLDLDMYTFYTVDLSLAITQLPMIILPFYFLARSYQWNWALPARKYYAEI